MLEVVSLADRKDLTETVARWRWQEWGQDLSLEYMKYQTEHNSQKNRLPMTFAALVNGEPAGTVAIWMNDLPSRQDLYPWLAGLYVVQELRGQGIAWQLQKKVIETVREHQYKEVFLYTNHIGYYERYGWEFVEPAPLRDGKLVRIYRYVVDREGWNEQ